MTRQSQKDRTILCRYHPTEVGEYLIHIQWSGEHVPGSPFHVRIVDTKEELRMMQEIGQSLMNGPYQKVTSGASVISGDYGEGLLFDDTSQWN